MLRAEGGADHAGSAAEFDEGAGGVDLDAGEVVAGEPGSDGRKVSVDGAEGCAEGFRRQPLVIGGGGLVLLLVDELLEGGLLLGAALEDQDDAAEGCGVGEGALVELGASERMGVAGESSDARVVDRLGERGSEVREAGTARTPGEAAEKTSDSRQGRQQTSRDPRHWFDSCCSDEETEAFLAGKLEQVTCVAV